MEFVKSQPQFEQKSRRSRLRCTMTKLIALAAAGLFVAGTMFAGEHGDCAMKVGNDGKMACHVSMATLNLTAEQKTKMDAALEAHHKAGCTEANEAKFMKEAEGILTADQYAKFKTECESKKDKSKA
jgi:Spy/CpxP family protein refolding chaperone